MNWIDTRAMYFRDLAGWTGAAELAGDRLFCCSSEVDPV